MRGLAGAALILLLLTYACLAQGIELPFKTNREIREEQAGKAVPADAGPGDAEETAADSQQPEAVVDPGKPILRVAFEETETIPGQPLTLRLTVLVPTFLPQPPVWPSFEAPKLLVRLPERATRPTSAQVGRETWSGITRRYLISPMVPGDFAIPPQEVLVTWSDPETGQPAQARLATEGLAFTGVIPEGAEGLDPFVAAESLTLEQNVEGEPGAMKAGDSVVRRVTATVEGVAPLFLPPLLPEAAIEGVAAYPDEPVVTPAADGEPGGTRSESVTFLAEGGGGGEVPPVTLDWFNLKSGKVETASAEGFAISVAGPPAASAEPRDWRGLALAGLVALLALGLGWFLLRRALPPLSRWNEARRTSRQGSEAFAYRSLRGVVARRDHAALRPALDLWAARVAGGDPRAHPGLEGALLDLGRARYGREGGGGEAAAWQAIAAALPDARAAARRPARAAALPPLNAGA